MKRFLAIALALALALPLAGCSKSSTWNFVLDRKYDADNYTARDGTVLAAYDYELPRLALVSGDASPGEQPPETVTAVRDAFNAEMEHRRALLAEEYHEMEQLAIADWSDRSAEERAWFTPTGNGVEIVETRQTPRLLSVRAAGYANWGGAYPWGFACAWNFDLRTGAFVTWKDLPDQPDALRAALAAEVMRQAREQGLDSGFFDGWEAEVERFEGCAVYFGADALTVVFDDQLLGPHAAGMPEFAIDCDGVSRYFNNYGKELLKKEG